MDKINRRLPIIMRRRRLTADDMEKGLRFCLDLYDSTDNKLKQYNNTTGCFIHTQSISIDDIENKNNFDNITLCTDWKPQSGLLNWHSLQYYQQSYNPIIWHWYYTTLSYMDKPKSRKFIVIQPQAAKVILDRNKIKSNPNSTEKQKEQIERLAKQLNVNTIINELKSSLGNTNINNSNKESLPCFVILHTPGIDHWSLLIRTVINEKWIIIDSMGHPTSVMDNALDFIRIFETLIHGKYSNCHIEQITLFRQQGGWECGWLTLASLDWILKTTLDNKFETIMSLPKDLDEYLFEQLYRFIGNKLELKM